MFILTKHLQLNCFGLGKPHQVGYLDGLPLRTACSEFITDQLIWSSKIDEVTSIGNSFAKHQPNYTFDLHEIIYINDVTKSHTLDNFDRWILKQNILVEKVFTKLKSGKLKYEIFFNSSTNKCSASTILFVYKIVLYIFLAKLSYNILEKILPYKNQFKKM